MSEDIFEMEIKEIRDNTVDQITQRVENFSSKIEQLWIKMFGKKTGVVKQRYETVLSHISSLCDEMYEEEKENFEELRLSLESVVMESEALKTELALSITLPFQVDIDGFDLNQQKEDLEDFLRKYRQIREERITLLEQYKNQEMELCNNLGIKKHFKTFNEVPSEAQLKAFELHLKEMTLEKENRTVVYLDTLTEIENLMNQLEISQISTLEKMALDRDKDFQLSSKNMEFLEEWKIRLFNQHEKETKLVVELQEKVSLLWDRLDIDVDEREQFIVKTAKKCGRSVIEQYRKELKRCEELKKANIETVILRLREDIFDLWDRCHTSAEDKKKFTDIESENFNEELLESHERKVEELKAYYDETRIIFELAEKWFQLWNKMISLESQSNNMQRLNNRGGQLLKEERERKRIQKELPKVETKLEKLVGKFEQNHNRPFLYEGIPLMSLIANYWDNRKIEKENEKEVRKIQNATKVTPLKSTNRVLTNTPATLSNRKRGRPITPVESLASRRNLVRDLQVPTSKSEKIIRRRSRSHDPTGRYGSQKNLRSGSNNSSIISYTGFQNYIETKNRNETNGMPLRSSLSPSKPGIQKVPSNIVTPLTKRTRLQTTYSSSKLPRLRPMIN